MYNIKLTKKMQVKCYKIPLNEIILVEDVKVSATTTTTTKPTTKSKAVPLHAMKALGGRGSIAPTHSRPQH
jgi:hypothetical protein